MKLELRNLLTHVQLESAPIKTNKQTLKPQSNCKRIMKYIYIKVERHECVEKSLLVSLERGKKNKNVVYI